MKRIVVGGFSHETNTFNPAPTGLTAFLADARYGPGVVSGRPHGCIGGFVEAMAEHAGEVELVGAVSLIAPPGGTVGDEVFDHVAAHLTETRRRTSPDAVYLDLHGAMVTRSHLDGEGDLLEHVRRLVGPAVPLVVTLDMHATLTRRMVRNADALSVYRCYPHTDLAERGREIAGVLLRTLRGEVRPVTALAKQPLLIGPPLNVLPQDLPMRRVYDRARELESTCPGVLLACPAHGFMQQDVPEAGTGVVVTTDGDRGLAQRLADELGEMLFAHRAEYWVALPEAAAAVRLAAGHPRPPVAISDGGDNIGAGTPGDGTLLLAEVLRQGVDSAFVQLWDPQSAAAAAAAGVGSTVTLEVGGRSHPWYGPPVRVTGRVSRLSDPGYAFLSARLEVGGITLLLNARPVGPNTLDHPHAMGVRPEQYRMILCKGGFAFRTAYPPSVYSYVLSATPGFSSTDLSVFPYTRITRPIYPLERI
jgi:microcystin degradation protein MlrC